MSSAEMLKGKSTKRSNEKGNKNSGGPIFYGRTLFPTIAQAFLNRVETMPGREAFFVKDGTRYQGVTWSEYYDNVRALSLGLASLGVGQGDRVCILSSTRLEWAASDLAILGAKAVTVPIYSSNTAEDCAYIINHSEAKVILLEDDRQLEKIRKVRSQLKSLTHIVVFSPVADRTLADEKDVLSLTALKEIGKRANAQKKKTFDENLNSLTPEDVFTICYTSGTTGQPKGVVLTFDNLNSLAEDIEKVIGSHISEKDILISFLPISHIFGKVESLLTYHFGWQIYYAESIEKLFINIGEARPTLLFAVPRIFEKAYTRIKSASDEGSALKKNMFNWAFQAGSAYYKKIWSQQKPTIPEVLAYKLAEKVVFSKVYAKFGGRIRYCIAGGAPLPLEIAQFMQIVGITILEGYGLTETCAPVTLNTPDALRFGTIGKPLPEATIKIAEDGEILVKSRKVFREYYKNPEATQEVLENNWFHTGDIGVIDQEGFVRITDRKKDLIVTSGGKNVAPQKLENLMKTFKYISQVVVVGDKRNYLAALLVLEKDETIKYAKENNILFSNYGDLVKHERIRNLVQKHIDQVNSKLAPYESIKKFEVLPDEFTIDTGELTPSLKVKRKFVNQKFKSVIDAIYGNEELH